ncbi:hypothetical protein ACIOC2_28995 [Streptomyces sp. NPDC088337]|uniref:hypothetical protein n=1 Tax=unclassified Streptomyces TaxID=2593676 RepID=UPI002DDC0DB5|nr:hypothetical protein [Streptomyces sp. NBC_01788]WSB26021.1 hypothetical protein OIE49_09040 [Streptomyces sp. NBC_01788]
MSDSVTGTEVREEAPAPESEAPGPGDAIGEHGPAAPAPLLVPRTPTGDARVDAALERLGDADHLATDGHLQVYEDVHGGLRDALTALDARPGPPAPPAQSPPYRHRS